MSERIRVVARVAARAGKEDEMRTILRALVSATRLEAGCIRYELWEEQDREGGFVFVEEWESATHLDAHLSGANLSEASAGIAGLTESPPDIRRYRVVA